jgi:hypothetical protein
MMNKDIPIPEMIKKILPDDKELKEDIESAIELTRARAIGHESDILPHLLVYTNKDGEKGMSVCVIGVPFNEWEEKSIVMEGMGAQFGELKETPTHIILTSMAWMSENPKDTTIQPRHDKNKKEAILVMALTLDQRCMVATAVVTRDKDNKITNIDEPIKMGEATGDLLPCFYKGYVTVIINRRKK